MGPKLPRLQISSLALLSLRNYAQLALPAPSIATPPPEMKGNAPKQEPPKKNQRPLKSKAVFMYPELHEAVAAELARDLPSVRFNSKDSDDGRTRNYNSHVMGSFICRNERCSRGGWGSKRVAIQIRGYRKNGYNALVYNQRCQSCRTLGHFKINEDSYVQRVAYWLRKW